MDQKHVKLSVIGFAIILIGLVSISYAFFNYTRTGESNTIRTGNIYFNAQQGLALNITNAFPLTSTEAANANLDTVTLGILGDTTYSDGEEFEIMLVDVTNTINNKEVPINYIATYTATTGGSIGTNNSDYFEDRNAKDANIYKLNATGEVKEGKQVLVGYIKNGSTGISGTLTIKAYIDADRIAISDTYNEDASPYYSLNKNMTMEEFNACTSYFNEHYEELTNPYHWFKGEFDASKGDSATVFCQGGKANDDDNTTFNTFLRYPENNGGFNSAQIDYLLSHNIIIAPQIDNYGTTSEWVDDRTVFTTTEWNSMSTTPISFKIKVESQEGIWIGKIDSCRDCVFAYYTPGLWTTWNTESETPTVLTSSDYEENYEDVISTSGKDFFLGLKLNGSNQIEKAYVCGLYNRTTPFCIEGTVDGSKYTTNKNLLQGTNLWNNTCLLYSTGTIDEETWCEAPSAGLVEASSEYRGGVAISDHYDICVVYSYGGAYCGVND